ncbi:MAG: hypothetical protein IKU86_07370 [Thermoguttaceae bacterium]|nr:hypothetical protein [Thermoguttaceae bacterium]
MKRSLSRWTFCALFGVAALGCQEKPEIAFEEYGETTAALPIVENLPDDFAIPEEADSPTCVVREQAINNSKSDREFYRKERENAKSNAAAKSQAK